MHAGKRLHVEHWQQHDVRQRLDVGTHVDGQRLCVGEHTKRIDERQQRHDKPQRFIDDAGRHQRTQQSGLDELRARAKRPARGLGTRPNSTAVSARDEQRLVHDVAVIDHTGFVDDTRIVNDAGFVDHQPIVDDAAPQPVTRSRATPAADSASRFRARTTLVGSAAGEGTRDGKERRDASKADTIHDGVGHRIRDVRDWRRRAESNAVYCAYPIRHDRTNTIRHNGTDTIRHDSTDSVGHYRADAARHDHADTEDHT